MPPALARHRVLRGLSLWAVVRFGFALALLLTAQPPLADGFAVAMGVVALTGGLALGDLAWRGELVLLGNLGVAPGAAAGVAALPAIAMELALQLALRLASR